MEEISLTKRVGVLVDATHDECVMKTGRPPISTRRVDVDKGRSGVVDIRSRLVARDAQVRVDCREFGS